MSNHSWPLEVVILLSIFSLFAIVTNTLVCGLVFKVKSMRNYTNGFVVSLAISDILTGTAFLLQYNLKLERWSQAALNALYAIVLFVGASNLCAVTYDRYLAILHPFAYARIIKRAFKILVPGIWLISIGIACIPFAWFEDNTIGLPSQIYNCSVLVICIALPFVLIVYANFKILLLVRRSVRRERQLSVSSSPSDKTNSKQNGTRKVSSEAKVARVFAIASFMFALSYFPMLYYTAAMTFHHRDATPKLMTQFSPFCIVFGSLVNPILYSFMKPDFRRAVKKILSAKQVYLDVRRSHRSSVPSNGDTYSIPFLAKKKTQPVVGNDQFPEGNNFYESTV